MAFTGNGISNPSTLRDSGLGETVPGSAISLRLSHAEGHRAANEFSSEKPQGDGLTPLGKTSNAAYAIHNRGSSSGETRLPPWCAAAMRSRYEVEGSINSFQNVDSDWSALWSSGDLCWMARSLSALSACVACRHILDSSSITSPLVGCAIAGLGGMATTISRNNPILGDNAHLPPVMAIYRKYARPKGSTQWPTCGH